MLLRRAMKLVLCISVLLMFHAPAVKAIPTFLEVQSGAMMGRVHVSYGMTLKQNHNISIGVGYVPELRQNEEITITSIKYRYTGDTSYHINLKEIPIEIKPFNFGITGITGHQDEIYTKSPPELPKGYYVPTARRVLFNYQVTAKLGRSTELYIDWSVLDVGMINYVRNFKFYKDNYKYLGLDGIVNYGFGIRKLF